MSEIVFLVMICYSAFTEGHLVDLENKNCVRVPLVNIYGQSA